MKSHRDANNLPNPSIVSIGGGTGTFTVLSGLRMYPVELCAVVAMSDSGGSTGRLRDEFGHLPVGDVRMALAALADEERQLIRELFLFRFDKGNGLSGHNFGNLFLTALTEILGSEEQAIRAASRVLRIKGAVLPVTTEHVQLVAEYDDGVIIKGETHIDEPPPGRDGHRIQTIRMEPKGVISEAAKAAIVHADMIVMGPGDLYTSVIAAALADGFSEALRSSKAHVVYISNLMSKYGQTSGMTLAEHVHVLAHYSGRMPDTVLVNATPLPQSLLARYAEGGEYPLVDDADTLSTAVVRGDFLANELVRNIKGDTLRRSLIRHDSERLARAIMTLI